jgi:hypothetical protein
MTEMDNETSVYYVHLTRLIAREDFIKNKQSINFTVVFAKLIDCEITLCSI